MSDGEDGPDLNLSIETICELIDMAFAFDAKDVLTDEASGSSAADDKMIDVLEAHGSDSVADIFTSAVDDLSADGQIDLVALMWLGRGDETAEDWATLRAEAEAAHNGRTASYLLGVPLLGSHLDEGLAKLGVSCRDARA
ncbi:MAG: DUF3775 domain-containing protein [Alphaproteobacteria bacterium]|nr:DUF3775 domain-containing protein [Alphaproteobacteria bacterium]